MYFGIRILAVFFACLHAVVGDYANYVRRGNKLEIAMEPVSSTVEPVAIYKLGPRSHHNYDDASKYEKNILLTVYNVHEQKAKHDKRITTNDGNEKQLVKIEPVN